MKVLLSILKLTEGIRIITGKGGHAMNILVVTGSPRRGGNTEVLADAFAGAAKESGHTVVVRKLSSLKVGPCLACEYCFSHDGVCVQKDDMNEILKDVSEAELLVIASPIYWFDVSAQTKCFIDRLYACAKKGFCIRTAAMLLDSGSPGVYAAAQAQLKDICDYLGWKNLGAITAPGMTEMGSIFQSSALEQVRTFAEKL